MKFKLLSGLLVSSVLLSGAPASAQESESTTTRAITDPAKIPEIAKPASTADTGSATKTKHHKKKDAAPAVSTPQTNIESHQPAYR